jgi:hypothetical protein
MPDWCGSTDIVPGFAQDARQPANEGCEAGGRDPRLGTASVTLVMASTLPWPSNGCHGTLNLPERSTVARQLR